MRPIRTLCLAGLCLSPLLAGAASAATIVDEWKSVAVPPPPVLQSVKADPATTALVILDMVQQRCNERPRCVDSVKPVSELLAKARAAHVPVIYTLVPGAKPADVVKELAPEKGDPVVTASADKFLKTDLEKILKDKGIKTIVTVGTAAEGAVLATSSEAAMRGFEVVVPVDGASSATPYGEQYTAWHLANAPGPKGHVTLTRTDMVAF
ncbi:Nicotinamidase-related amidase [Faunimonas pinastri]|uniref:Nicotinamidase-related amidase n=1 Tax=Faunimonas pinastri TaxID=1855383 RepID=A0A1H9K087_9HYPH|nr:cysteine hydrolase [Faunimonas pinastri]SEQ92509.1 Nicotinamidase-related amidase [Faunimonas pinastri]